MNIKRAVSNLWPLLVFLAFVTFMFFPEYQGKTLERSDAIQSQAKMKALIDYRKADNKMYIWNPAQFGGMPMLYGAPSSKNVLRYVDNIIKLGQTRPMSIYFIAFLSAFLLGRIGFGMGNLLSMFLSFSSTLPLTNLILWKAGHTSKIDVLSYTSLLILGVVLIFERKKYILGFVIMSFGVAMSLYLRHPQMTYYIFMVFLIYGLLKLFVVIKEKQDWKSIGIGIALLVAAGTLGIGSSATKIWSMKVHSEASMRGAPILKSTDLGGPNSSSKVEGLNWQYAMQWSNGLVDLGGTFIPRFVGGGSGEKVSNKSESFKKYRMTRAPLYWGKLPFTEAPMYLGAVSIFLFLLGSIYVRGLLKWWLIGGVLLTYLISMGINFEWFNKLIFDYMPLYNKFRAPQSVLSITPYFLSLLGVLAVYKLIKEGTSKEFIKALYISGGLAGGFALVSYFLFPSVLSFEGSGDASYTQQGVDTIVFIADRKSALRSDSLRSFLFVGLSFLILWAFAKSKLSKVVMLGSLMVLTIADNLGVNNRYLGFSDYKSKKEVENNYQPRAVDQQILSVEKNRYDYRVMDQTINTFSAANTSFFHNTLGGYDPVKLQRIEDLKNGHLLKNNMNVYNMLNAKYFISPGQDGTPQLQQNPQALGTSWFVNKLRSVNTPDEEFAALQDIEVKSEAIILAKEFDEALKGLNISSLSDQGSIEIKEYSPDRIVYSSTNTGEGVAVFSEIWFNGESWKVHIDGKETPLLRVNYALRAVRVPAGSHEIVFEFKPASFHTGEKVTLASSLVLLLIGIGALVMFIKDEMKKYNLIESPAPKTVKKRKKKK